MSKFYQTVQPTRQHSLRCSRNAGCWEVWTRGTKEVVFSGNLADCERFIREEEEVANGGIQIYF